MCRPTGLGWAAFGATLFAAAAGAQGLDGGRDTLSAYGSSGQIYELDAPVEDTLFPDPEDWAARNGLKYQGLVRNGEVLPVRPSQRTDLLSFQGPDGTMETRCFALRPYDLYCDDPSDFLAQNTGEPVDPLQFYSTGTGVAQVAFGVEGDMLETPVTVENLPPNTIDPGHTRAGDAEALRVACADIGVTDVLQSSCFLGAVALHTSSTVAGRPRCSGIVISPIHILTAAHCLFTSSGGVIQDFWVTDPVLGMPSAGHRGRVELVARFPNSPGTPIPWEDRSQPAFYDVADLALLRAAPGNDFHPVRVPGLHQGDVVAIPLLAVGYGENPDPAVSGYRQWVRLAEVGEACPDNLLADRSVCSDAFEFVSSEFYSSVTRFASESPPPRLAFVGETSRAAAATDGLPPDTCNGDSGGPVFAFDGSVWALSAITSRGLLPVEDDGASSCTGHGGIYVRVGPDSILSWIATTLEEDGCTPEDTGASVRYSNCS